MPRILGLDKYEIEVTDPVEGDTVTFFYRLPTTKERENYSNSLITTRRNKITPKVSQTRREFGAKILLGFKDPWPIKKDGKIIRISSDPTDKSYDSNWKEFIMTGASDLVEAMCFQIFEGATATGTTLEFEEPQITEESEVIDNPENKESTFRQYS